MYKSKNKNAFTIIETLIVLGLVSLMSIGIYAFYANQRNKVEIENFATALDVFNADLKDMAAVAARDDTYIDTSTAALRPQVLASKVSNYNGYISMNGASLKTKHSESNNISVSVRGVIFENDPYLLGYTVNLGTVPTAICKRLFQTDFLRNKPGIIVGTTTLVNGSTLPNDAWSGVGSYYNNYSDFLDAGLNLCDTSNNVAFGYFDYYNNDLALNPVNPSDTERTPWQMKPTMTTSAYLNPGDCTGGTAYNGSFCACPVGTQWYGKENQCIAYGARPGWCAPGINWNKQSQTCETENKYVGKDVEVASINNAGGIQRVYDPITGALVGVEFNEGNNLSATYDAATEKYVWNNPVDSLNKGTTTVANGYYIDEATGSNNSDTRIGTLFSMSNGTTTTAQADASYYNKGLKDSGLVGQPCSGIQITFDVDNNPVQTPVTGVFNGTFCELPSSTNELTTEVNEYRAVKP